MNPPTSSAIKTEHSKKLFSLIKTTLEENDGWLGFDQFMNLALNAPGLGYYAAGAVKIGQSGDFVTAPMIGAGFARCLAKQCAEILTNIENDEETIIVEFGAGTGQLCFDLLDALIEFGAMPSQYLIVETSADLKQRQEQSIRSSRPQYLEVVKWIDSLPEDGVSGIIIGNELLDTMPVIRFRVGADGYAQALGVSIKEDALYWSASTRMIPNRYQQRLQPYDLPVGYESEIGAYAEGWVRSIGEKLKTGVMILIDYGFPQSEFYHWDRSAGTIMCHYQHAAHDNPLINPGLQDITAHVDFSAIAQAAVDVDLEVAGYCGQGSFLLSLGLLDNLASMQTEQNPSKDSILLAQEIKKLTLPHEMGEIFKVIALTRNYENPLSGFTMQNHRGRL